MVTTVRPLRPAGPRANVPAHLEGLVAANPNLLRDYNADPGLRAFLDVNKGNISQLVGPPAGKKADTLTWETWCHTTNIVPAKVRDEEYIVVVARGDAYDNGDKVQLPLTDGKTATSDGKIVFVAKTRDLLGSQKVADEGGHYPGAITVNVGFPVYGAAGEKVSLAYCRVSPDAKGQLHPSYSGWPDSFKGVYGGYSGRELEVAVNGGKRQYAESPDGCSTRSAARVI